MKNEVFNKLTVDGQELFFLTNQQWKNVIIERKFKGVLLPNRTIQYLNFVALPVMEIYSEILITGGFFGNSPHFLIYPLIKCNFEFQRIDLIGIKCSSCDWKGIGAYPLIPEIYWGISEEYSTKELMDMAKKRFKKTSCPKCNGAFDRYIIKTFELHS